MTNDETGTERRGVEKPKTVVEWFGDLPLYVFMGLFITVVAAIDVCHRYTEEVSAIVVLGLSGYIVITRPEQVAHTAAVTPGIIADTLVEYALPIVIAVSVVGALAIIGFGVVHGLDSGESTKPGADIGDADE